MNISSTTSFSKVEIQVSTCFGRAVAKVALFVEEDGKDVWESSIFAVIKTSVPTWTRLGFAKRINTK
ncbi:MAG: hypothetical protein IJP65_02585 [Bacteroidales bacterium]|nr:hypothetical protein [Bacteroidales bacterium]